MITAPCPSTKGRLRGPNLATFTNSREAVPMEEALRSVDAGRLVLASNKRLGEPTARSNLWFAINQAFLNKATACWSGTMAAYDKPDKKLGKTIEYIDSQTGMRYVFPVPEAHQGKKNVVLVAEHPDFMLETDGNTRVVQAKDVWVVSEFPVASEKWYLGDAKYDIPTGKKVDADNAAARLLSRIAKRVGLVARSYCDRFGFDRRVVSLSYAPYRALGIVIEAGEKP